MHRDMAAIAGEATMVIMRRAMAMVTRRLCMADHMATAVATPVRVVTIALTATSRAGFMATAHIAGGNQ